MFSRVKEQKIHKRWAKGQTCFPELVKHLLPEAFWFPGVDCLMVRTSENTKIPSLASVYASIFVHWIIRTIPIIYLRYIPTKICIFNSMLSRQSPKAGLHIFDGHPIITCGAMPVLRGIATTCCPLSCRNDLTDSARPRGPDGSALRGNVPTSHSPLRWDA